MIFGNMFGGGVPEILPGELKQKLDAGEDLHLIDVRELQEYEEARIDNTVLVPQAAVGSSSGPYAQAMNDILLDKEKEVIVICRSGMRSLMAGQALTQMGFSNVKSLKSGVIGWANSGFPVSSGAIARAV